MNEYLTVTGEGEDSIESISFGGTHLNSLAQFSQRYPQRDDDQYDITVDEVGQRVYYLLRFDKRIDSTPITGKMLCLRWNDFSWDIYL